MYGLGLLTGTVKDEYGRLYYKIFIPTTPNPTTGFLEIVEASAVIRSGLTVEERIRIIMSGGILGPETMCLHAAAETGVPVPRARRRDAVPEKDLHWTYTL